MPSKLLLIKQFRTNIEMQPTPDKRPVLIPVVDKAGKMRQYFESSEGKEEFILILIVLANLIIKLIPASILELSNDEVYYWTYALFPDWSHFDHPPMVGLTIQLFTLNLTFQSELAFRAGALLFSSFNIIILYKLTKKILPGNAALITTALFTASFYFNIICGFFILPDTPQMLFVLLALNSGLPAIVNRNPSKSDKLNLMLFGFFTGLAFLSKYHSLFLWFGFLVFILFHNRVWLKNQALYISLLITIVLMTPVIYWNVINNFISFTFHGERMNILHSHINPASFLQFNAGQIFYQNPIVFVIVLLAVFSAFRKRRKMGGDLRMLLLYISLPLILIFSLLSIFRFELPHWSGPAFICLLILAGEWLSEVFTRHRNIVINSLLSANIFFILVLITATLQIKSGVVLHTIKNTDPTTTGHDDPTLDMYGWKQASEKFQLFLSEDNIDRNKIELVSDKWFPAAHIDFYIAHHMNINLIVPSNIGAAHKYFWINKKRPVHQDYRFFYITSSQHFAGPDELSYMFSGSIPVDTIKITRRGEVVKNLFIYEMTGLKGHRDTSFLNNKRGNSFAH